MRRTLPNFKFQEQKPYTTFYHNAFTLFTLFTVGAIQLHLLTENQKAQAFFEKILIKNAMNHAAHNNTFFPSGMINPRGDAIVNRSPFFNREPLGSMTPPNPGFDGFFPEKALNTFEK